MESKTRFDLLAEFAFPLPVIVIAEMLGIPLWAGDFDPDLLFFAGYYIANANHMQRECECVFSNDNAPRAAATVSPTSRGIMIPVSGKDAVWYSPSPIRPERL